MKYKKRFEDRAKQFAYMNAIDVLSAGGDRSRWFDCYCKDKNTVWKQAVKDVEEMRKKKEK